MSAARIVLAGVLPLAACGDVTHELWREEFKPEYEITRQEYLLSRNTLRLGVRDGQPALALEVDPAEVPREWHQLLTPAHRLPGAESVEVLVCTASRRAALVHTLLESRSELGASHAALILRAGHGITATLPWKIVLILFGRFRRDQVASVFDREAVEIRHPRLVPVLDQFGLGDGYGLAARTFMNQPWLEWSGTPHRQDSRNRLLAVVRPGGEPIASDERSRLAALFEAGSTPTLAELREAQTLTAVGRMLDDAGNTIGYLSVPVPTLLLARFARITVRDAELTWHFESDWDLEPRSQLPTGFDDAAPGLPLQRIELALQTRTRKRVRHMSVFEKILLTPLTMTWDAIFDDDCDRDR